MANRVLNLYRVIFASQSSRDYTGTDGQSVWEALNSASDPIVSVTLLKANVSSSTAVEPAPAAPSYPAYPWPPAPGPYPPGPPGPSPFPPPHPGPAPEFALPPLYYTNALAVPSIESLYATTIVFGNKPVDAYKQDFVELKKRRSVYLFSVPGTTTGTPVTVTGFTPQTVRIDPYIEQITVEFYSVKHLQASVEEELYLTTLVLTPTGITGGSRLVRQDPPLPTTDLVDGRVYVKGVQYHLADATHSVPYWTEVWNPIVESVVADTDPASTASAASASSSVPIQSN